jgi:hypothetical protein
MIDVYFCSAAKKGSLRERMSELCYLRWKKSPTRCRLHILAARNTRWHLTATAVMELDIMQRSRRMYADSHSQGEIYCIADDDCLPENEDFLEKAFDLVSSYPQFGALALAPNNSELRPWTPELRERERICVDAAVFDDENVMEHVSAGGIVFYRKNVVQNWIPVQAGNSGSYDTQHAECIRAAGKRVGFIKTVKMNHIGRGYSSHWEGNDGLQ